LTLLVVDANVVIAAATSKGFAELEEVDPVAPPLLWPEARSALHTALVRGRISEVTAADGMRALESGFVTERRHRRLGREAWAIADELGWTKTYDAEYLALARVLEAPLATLDRRLARAAVRVGVELDPRFG
jgi:predicted nucleic acid-binding protein